MHSIHKSIVISILVMLYGCANWNQMADDEKSTRAFLAPGTLGLSLLLKSNSACEKIHCREKGSLIYAAEAGDTDRVKHLLANGDDVNQKGNLGRTALWYAAENNRYISMKVLLSANPEQFGKDIALVIAARKGHIDMSKLLLEHNASPNFVYRYNSSALANAAFAGKWRVIEILLGAGAYVDLKDLDGKIAIDYVKNCSECTQLLLGKKGKYLN